MTAPSSSPDPHPPSRRGSYGIDAPYVPGLLLAAALAFAALAVILRSPGFLLSTLFLGLAAGLYLHTTWRGKFKAWERILDDLDLRGDETVVDLGCGRGAVLLAAAKRIPRGHAIGVDLWRSVDQSGNAEATTRANAEVEGVSERVELRTADLRRLPFDEGSIDIVTSSLAIHNIRDVEGRAAAVRESFRILRPGGRLVIADIRGARHYASVLEDAGGVEVQVLRGDPSVWFGGPWQAVTIVRAWKPAAR